MKEYIHTFFTSIGIVVFALVVTSAIQGNFHTDGESIVRTSVYTIMVWVILNWKGIKARFK